MPTKTLKSSIESIGEEVDQIVGFDNGDQKTFRNVLSNTIEVGLFTKFKCKDGKLVAINHRRVNWFEVH